MYIISEISPQFHGNEQVAEQMILQSKMAGADAIKVQLYTATQFGSERAYLEMPFDQLERLKKYADSLNIDLFATPFTFDRLDWCVKLDLPFMKVAARMHQEMPELTSEIMKVGKPTFVSIPAETDPNTIEQFGHATYFHCIVQYPTRIDEFEIPDFHNSIFSGVSDHSIGIAGSLYAAAHGATHLEKHFTLDHAFQFNTEKAHVGSMNADQLAQIKNLTGQMERIKR
jgi:sialic acid synthase SpsE